MPRGQDAWIIALVLIGLGGLCILHLITRLLKVYIQLTLAGVPMSLWHFIKIRRRVRGQRLRALAIALISAHKSARASRLRRWSNTPSRVEGPIRSSPPPSSPGAARCRSPGPT